MNRYLTFFLLLALAGCSSAKVLNTEKAADVDLATYKTFDFYKFEANADTSSQNYHASVEKLEDAIALQMQRFGYLLSKTDPDLLVNIGVVLDQEVQTRQTDFRTDAPRYIGQRRYSWKSKEVEIGNYTVGTVTVDLVDRKENTLVWQGAVEDILPKKQSRLETTINKGIQKLFSRYPLKAK